MTTKVGVATVGASGYAARELVRIMVNHPYAELTVATSRSDEEPRLEACIRAFCVERASDASHLTPRGLRPAQHMRSWRHRTPQAWRLFRSYETAVCG